jgi:hypothetical protein
VNPITDEVAARLVGAEHSDDTPARSLSPPSRSAIYESFGDLPSVSMSLRVGCRRASRG